MIIGLDPNGAKIEVYDLVTILRDKGATVGVEHAGGGCYIVRAELDGGNVTAGPFGSEYGYADEIYYGDDRIDEVGDWWGEEEGTALQLANDMLDTLKAQA